MLNLGQIPLPLVMGRAWGSARAWHLEGLLELGICRWPIYVSIYRYETSLRLGSSSEFGGSWHGIFNFWSVHYWSSYSLKYHKGSVRDSRRQANLVSGLVLGQTLKYRTSNLPNLQKPNLKRTKPPVCPQNRTSNHLKTESNLEPY